MEDRKCPKTCPVETPDLCVRVKDSSDGKGTYTSMSMCEFERVSCRLDVTTMIVPFKFCFAHRHEEDAVGEVVSKQTENMKTEVERSTSRGVEVERRNEEEDMTLKIIKPTRTQKLDNLITEVKRRNRSIEVSGKEEKTTSKIIKPTRTRQLENLGTEVKIRKRSIKDLRHLERDPCFRQCPVRSQLVCARCQHGVFRTFMSLCHLREHQCGKRKDQIELVARRPCASTGLYFELPRPVAVVAEPGDSDPVLEYIYSVLDSRPHVTINPDRVRDSKTTRKAKAGKDSFDEGKN